MRKTRTRCGQKREPSAQNRALRGCGCPPSPGLCGDAVTYFLCGINIVFLKTEPPFIQVYYQVLGASLCCFSNLTPALCGAGMYPSLQRMRSFHTGRDECPCGVSVWVGRGTILSETQQTLPLIHIFNTLCLKRSQMELGVLRTASLAWWKK